MDLSFCARYPFSKSAREHIRSLKFASESEVNYDILEKAKMRVLLALEKQEVPMVASSIGDALNADIASYAVARMIISCLKSRYWIGKYAVAESKRAGKYLRADRSGEELEKISEEFGINCKNEAMPVFQYAEFAPRAIEYKLVNQQLENGNVKLDRNKAVRVVEEAIRLNIARSLPIKIEMVPEKVKKAAEDVRAKLPKEEFRTGKVEMKNFPPCIQKMLADLRESENLPHTARWALAVFLLNVGTDVEGIVKTFSTAPDYDEHTTRYQVNHAAQRGYRMPSCAGMEGYGLCVNRCGIKNPLSYKG
ncbi:MAG: hypothetical protein ABIH99_01745 [Candidatus Micrarchaeota archaeon]